MLCNTKIALVNNSAGHKDTHGSWVQGEPEIIKYIYVDMQPYNKGLLLKNYGYDIEVNKRFFINHKDKDIRIGSIFQYVNNQGVTENYEVKLIPWDEDYMEVICSGL